MLALHHPTIKRSEKLKFVMVNYATDADIISTHVRSM
jgi:hypothetical protein